MDGNGVDVGGGVGDGRGDGVAVETDEEAIEELSRVKVGTVNVEEVIEGPGPSVVVLGEAKQPAIRRLKGSKTSTPITLE